MKAFSSLCRPALGLLFTAFTLFTISSCEDEPQETPVDPALKKYAGTWAGNTSQGTYIELGISGLSDKVALISLDLAYDDGTGIKQRHLYSANGLAELDTSGFVVQLPEGGILSGNFPERDLLTGFISTFSMPDHDSLKMGFSAVLPGDSLSINAPCRLSYTLSEEKHILIQDLNKTHAVTFCRDTSMGFIAGSALASDIWFAEQQPLMRIDAGPMQNITDLERDLAPGKKRFSSDGTDGFLIRFFNPNEWYLQYSTPDDSDMPLGGYFEVVELKRIETYNPLEMRYKFIARFDLTLFLQWGRSIRLRDGYYSGYIQKTLSSK